MASFVVHHTAAMHFLKKLEESGIKISQKNKNDFLLGNLIVDSIDKEINVDKQIQKKTTHFSENDNEDKIVQYPNLDLFLDKYIFDLENGDFKVLGYFFHLYTDYKFFNDLFKTSFTFLDREYKETVYTQNAVYVNLHKDGKIINYKDLWTLNTETSIYDDYTTINKIVLEYFKYGFDYENLKNAAFDFENISIEEINPKNITSVLDSTNNYIKESYATNNELKVFNIDDILNFVPEVVDSFSSDFSKVISNYNQPLKLTKKKN